MAGEDDTHTCEYCMYKCSISQSLSVRVRNSAVEASFGLLLWPRPRVDGGTLGVGGGGEGGGTIEKVYVEQ